jgi:hypothetical protein
MPEGPTCPYRGRSDDRPHGRPGRQDRRLRFPSPQGRTLGALGEELGPPTKAGAAPPRRGLSDEGGGGPGLPLVRGELPPGVMERAPSSLSRKGSGGKWRPPIAPGCRGSGGAPDERGRRGAPRRASALSSPGRQKKGGRKRKSEDKENGAHGRRSHPRARIPELPIHNIGSWGPGVGDAPGPSPATLKGSRTTAWRPAGVQHRSVGTV